MGTVKGPAYSLDASGNIAGICYTKWRGLNIARSVWSGTIPNTAKQVIIQGYMTAVSQEWSGTLTEKERQAWIDAAKNQNEVSKLGVNYIPTGYNYFMKLNVQRKRRGLTIMTMPPGAMIADDISDWLHIYRVSVPDIRIYAFNMEVVAPDDFKVEIWKAGPFDNAGRRPIKPEFSFLAFQKFNSDYYDIYITNGKYYWYKIRFSEVFGRVGGFWNAQVYAG